MDETMDGEVAPKPLPSHSISNTGRDVWPLCSFFLGVVQT